MKKFLLIVLGCAGLLSSASAQSFTTVYDTTGLPSGTPVSLSTTIENAVVNKSVRSVTLQWHVVASDFPKSWWYGVKLGICDNHQCYNNDTVFTPLWNGSTGKSFVSDLYLAGDTGDFHMVISLAGAAGGTHYMTVNLQDTLSKDTKNVTFLVTRSYLGVSTVVKSEDDVVLYPNPAINELNVVFNEDAGVKTIVVYNLIGRVVSVYKVTGNSAKLNVDNIPSGVYFVRLMNAQGGVVATRKFNRQ